MPARGAGGRRCARCGRPDVWCCWRWWTPGDGGFGWGRPRPPYASETVLLREVLASFDALPPCPVVGDRGDDVVDGLERLQPLRAVPALRMKDTWRYAVRHPLRRASQEGWPRWGRSAAPKRRIPIGWKASSGR